MTLLIAGGSGFLGAALARTLRAAGHRVMILTRRPRIDGDVQWLARRNGFGMDTDAKRLGRLFFQPALVAAALWSTRD